MAQAETETVEETEESYVERLFTAHPFSYLNRKILHVDKWHPASQTFLYFFIIGAILIVLNLFSIIPWGILWIYSFFVIIMWGFMFTKPNQKYSIILVLTIFVILMFIPTRSAQMLLNVNWDENDPTKFSGLYTSIRDLSRNPFNADTLTNFFDVVNWIYFAMIVGYGVSVVGDVISFQWGNIAKKTGLIALSIAVMSVIYGIAGSANIHIRTVWDTVGSAWGDFISNIGLAQLDASGNAVITAGTVVNGLFRVLPLIIIIANLSFALYFRKRAFHSLFFARGVMEKETIEVKRTTFTTPTLIMLLAMILYIVGYNLMTADPVLIVDPTITLTFYISSGIILILIGMKIIIINKDMNFGSFTKSFIKWTIFGLMGLFLYFQAFQPALYDMGILSQPTGMLTIGESSLLLGNDALNQLFIVAAPETLIFQVAITGIGNRVYFKLRKGSLMKKNQKRLQEKKEKLLKQLERMPISGRTRQITLNNLVKRAVINKKLIEIENDITENETAKLPLSYFILPTMILSLFAAFIFSDYHMFRRGMDFQSWWQNYQYGLTYMGAGFFLNLIAMFNWLSAIFVHWLNNLVAMAMAG